MWYIPLCVICRGVSTVEGNKVGDSPQKKLVGLLCVVLFGEASCLFLCLMGRPEVGMVTIYWQRLCHSTYEEHRYCDQQEAIVYCAVRSLTTVKEFSLANLFCSKCQLCVQYTTDKWNTLHLFGAAIIPATYIHENLFQCEGQVCKTTYKPVYNTLGFVCRESLSEPSTLGSIVVARRPAAQYTQPHTFEFITMISPQ